MVPQLNAHGNAETINGVKINLLRTVHLLKASSLEQGHTSDATRVAADRDYASHESRVRSEASTELNKLSITRFCFRDHYLNRANGQERGGLQGATHQYQSPNSASGRLNPSVARSSSARQQHQLDTAELERASR